MNAAELPNNSERLKALAASIEPAEKVLIVTHDFPDPDCLGAAFGLSLLFTDAMGVKDVTIAHGGFVGRAENRAMVRLLGIAPRSLCYCDLSVYDRVVVVDALPGAANISLPPETKVHAVFDHHLGTPPENAAYFYDVRKNAGAVSTVVTGYLAEAGLIIPPLVATGLFYGIKTDTAGLSRDAFDCDVAAYKLLFDLCDHGVLTKIEHPERGAEFFRTIHQAASRMELFGNAAHVFLGSVSTPDYVGEMADFFLCLKDLEWVVTGGIFGETLFYSVRAKTLETAGAAAEKIGVLIGGSGGGHGRIGAGRVEAAGLADPAGVLKAAVLKVLEIEDQKPLSLLDLK